MKIVFLRSCRRDLEWFRTYYRSVFPAGRPNAKEQYARTKLLLQGNPYIGHPSDDEEGMRELGVARTPFAFIYRVTEEHIEVVRVWDQRADRPIRWSERKQ